MTANNEIGTIQDINILSRIAAEHDILFHTDAVQAAGQIEIDVQDMDIDLLSLSAHKFNGPKGVGILYVKKGVKLIPQLSGGSQERNRRAGTVNVPGVIGMGKAAELAKDELKIKKENLLYLREYFLDRIFAEFDDIRLNGAKDENRLPGNINISFRNLDGQSILFNLSLNNIAASTGSACASGSISNSHVLKAINLDKDYIDGAIRFSLGYGNTKEEINQVMEVLPGIIKRLKELNQ
jgi:cysteine desulfurase